jgi:hypothetical protein
MDATVVGKIRSRFNLGPSGQKPFTKTVPLTPPTVWTLFVQREILVSLVTAPFTVTAMQIRQLCHRSPRIKKITYRFLRDRMLSRYLSNLLRYFVVA